LKVLVKASVVCQFEKLSCKGAKFLKITSGSAPLPLCVNRNDTLPKLRGKLRLIRQQIFKKLFKMLFNRRYFNLQRLKWFVL
jgi:hypothetical protein